MTLAAKSGNVEICEILLKFEADPIIEVSKFSCTRTKLLTIQLCCTQDFHIADLIPLSWRNIAEEFLQKYKILSKVGSYVL